MEKFNLKLLTLEQKQLRARILQLGHELNQAHLGSCLSSVDLISTVYKTKKDDEKFVLSNGHAGFALYAVLEKYGKIKDLNIVKKMYVHPDRDTALGIYVSTGSLGQGLPIALGMSLANKNKNVYCIISDGECTEGSIWEALRIISERQVLNLKILMDANGWSGYDPVKLNLLEKRLEGFGFNLIKVNGHNIDELSSALSKGNDKPTIIFAKTTVDQFPFLKGQDAHYYIMSDTDYNLALNLLK